MNTVQCTVSGKLCTVQQVIDFPQYNMKCRAKKVNPRGIFHVVSRFPPRVHMSCCIAEIWIPFLKM